jgi:hypothetical protein
MRYVSGYPLSVLSTRNCIRVYTLFLAVVVFTVDLGFLVCSSLRFHSCYISKLTLGSIEDLNNFDPAGTDLYCTRGSGSSQLSMGTALEKSILTFQSQHDSPIAPQQLPYPVFYSSSIRQSLLPRFGVRVA